VFKQTMVEDFMTLSFGCKCSWMHRF